MIFENLEYNRVDGGLAQLLEHRFCTPRVAGGTPVASKLTGKLLPRSVNWKLF